MSLGLTTRPLGENSLSTFLPLMPGGDVPDFALLPTRVPQRGLLCSTVVHVVVLALLPFLPQLLPPPPLLAYPKSDVNLAYEPITFDGLPAVSEPGGGPGGGHEGGSPGAPGGQPARRGTPGAVAKVAASQGADGSLPKMVYAGPQEIVSNSPNPTNTVQTIRRPDLLTPPKLKFAVRLKSMVLTPAPAPAVALVAPPPPPAPPAPELAVVPAPVVDNPALPVRVPQQKTPKLESREAPKLAFKQQTSPIPDVRNHALPILAQPDQGAGTKAAVVVNAVSVPEDSSSTPPDAELEGSFAVMPLRKLAAANLPVSVGVPGGSGGTAEKGTAGGTGASGEAGGGHGNGNGGTANGTGNGSGSGGIGTGSGGGTGSGTAAGGTGTGNGAGGRGTGTGSGVGSGRGTGSGSGPGMGSGTGTGTGGGTGTGSGSGTGPGAGAGSRGVPGIVIIGGSSGRGSTLPRTALPPGKRSYDIMIISGGASSGASRDLGVFSREETVYTVYINMADAGGGPAYSMQYAVLGASSSGSALLSPPFAVKKSAATATAEQMAQWARSGPVFVTGMIDEHGRLDSLRAVNPQDPRSSAALAAFTEWKFEPAQLSGKPVAAKVLIGVLLTPQRDDKAGQ